jgi:pimeloyl-ACP methyl ester carboxylesterase
MGGWVAITAAAEHGDRLAGIVVLDAPVRRRAPEELAAAEGVAFGPLRTYPSLDAALARFRTVPDQPTSLPYVLEHVARTSVREVDGGWTWKFDPRIFDRPVPTGELLRRVRCRMALFRSQYGLVTPDIGAYMYEQLGRIAPVVEVPLAHHHVMLDQPIPLVTGLRTLLADWEHSHPRRRA